MSARRLLVLCYFFPPLAGGGVHRVLGFTRHLPDHGWDCTVVCAGAEDYWVTDHSLFARVSHATEVIRVSGGGGLVRWLKWRRGGAGRRSGAMFAGLRALSDWWLIPDSYQGWGRRARRVATRLVAARRERRDAAFDAVLSSSPPDSVHLQALSLRRRFGLPWIADFRDPWIGLHYRRPPTSWHRANHLRLERAVLSAANRVLVASAHHAESLAERTRAGEIRTAPVVHLPNGFEAEPARTGTAHRGVPGAEGGGGPAGEHFALVFTGTLSLMPDTEVFLEAVHEVLSRHPEARRRLRARLIGPFDTDYADRATALGLTGIVEFTGPLAYEETQAWQRRADLLLLWKPRGCPAMVPGKLYEYLDTGRPLLALLEAGEEAARLVERAGGSRVSPGDRAGTAVHIERHYRAWREGRPLRGHRPEWLDEHTRARLAARLAAVLDELAGEQP